VAAVPKLPDDISPDGREIWDWAARLSDQVQRADEIKRLRQQITNAETQCGSCAHWMTGQCPREQHGNKTGRTGPSSLSVKCEKFSMPAWQTKELDAAKSKLSKLVAGAAS
jgi:hypothetical protein